MYLTINNQINAHILLAIDQVITDKRSPAGRFLIVTREDLHGDARRRFVARCATGDWDLVIMTHETFSSLPVPAQVERAWLEDQLGELESYARTEGYTGKRIAAAVRSLQGRLEKLRSAINDPKAVTFKSLGIDYLIVDLTDLPYCRSCRSSKCVVGKVPSA